MLSVQGIFFSSDTLPKYITQMDGAFDKYREKFGCKENGNGQKGYNTCTHGVCRQKKGKRSV